MKWSGNTKLTSKLFSCALALILLVGCTSNEVNLNTAQDEEDYRILQFSYDHLKSLYDSEVQNVSDPKNENDILKLKLDESNTNNDAAYHNSLR